MFYSLATSTHACLVYVYFRVAKEYERPRLCTNGTSKIAVGYTAVRRRGGFGGGMVICNADIAHGYN